MRRMKRKKQQRERERAWMRKGRNQGRTHLRFHVSSLSRRGEAWEQSRDHASFALKLQNPCTLLKPPSKPKICFCQMIHTVAPIIGHEMAAAIGWDAHQERALNRDQGADSGGPRTWSWWPSKHERHALQGLWQPATWAQRGLEG